MCEDSNEFHKISISRYCSQQIMLFPKAFCVSFHFAVLLALATLGAAFLPSLPQHANALHGGHIRHIQHIHEGSTTALRTSFTPAGNLTAPNADNQPLLAAQEFALNRPDPLLRGNPNWKTHAPNFVFRTIDDLHRDGNIKEAATKTWESRRYLLDRMVLGSPFIIPYSGLVNQIQTPLSHKIALASFLMAIITGQSTLIKYSNHVEGVLITHGEGTIELCHEDQREGMGFALLKLEPGTFYGLGGQEKHYLTALPGADMHVSCAFNPPVDGAEDHDENGVYPAIGEDQTKRYTYSKDDVPLLFKPPITLAEGSDQGSTYQDGQGSEVSSTTSLSTSTLPFTFEKFTVRYATRGDGKSMWKLAQDAGLDINSPYMYNLFCRHYTDTCVVVEDNQTGKGIAYLLGYKVPNDVDALFVWQIGVHPQYQRQGLAMKMMSLLVDNTKISYLEATVTPTNDPSNGLFRQFAERNGCDISLEDDWISEDDFSSDDKHEGESLYRIGPITTSAFQLLDKGANIVNKKISTEEVSSDGSYNTIEHESNARTYSRKFSFVVSSAKGCTLTTTSGNEYLDFLSCAGTLALGHNHPVQNDAIMSHLASGKPLQSLDIATTARSNYIKELFSFLPQKLQDYRVQFCGPTGSDAVDAAIKLCKIATGRSMVYSFHGGYHGVGQGPLAMTGNLYIKSVPGLGNDNVHFLPFPSTYRNPFQINGKQGEEAVMAYISNLLDDCESGVSKPACVVTEVVQGEGGLNSFSSYALKELRRITQMHDIPLVLDEVQSGFCRSGRRFAFEYSGITPDVLVLSKAAGGSQPLSAIVYDKSLDKWTKGMHAGTFRGNGLAFSAGAATLKFMREEKLWKQVEKKGDLFRGTLEAASCKYIGDIRGLGLMIGLELVDPSTQDANGLPKRSSELCAQTQKECLNRGLVIEVGGRGGTVLRPLPPLIATDSELRNGARIIVDSINAAAGRVIE